MKKNITFSSTVENIQIEKLFTDKCDIVALYPSPVDEDTDVAVLVICRTEFLDKFHGVAGLKLTNEDVGPWWGMSGNRKCFLRQGG